MRWGRRLVVGIAVTGMLGACRSSSPPPGATVTTPATPTATSSPPPSPEPSPSSEPSRNPVPASPSVVPTIAGATRLPGSETPLRPGTYAFTGFEPSLSFRLGTGWESGHELDDFFDVAHVQHPAVVVVFADLGFVYDGQGVRRDVAAMTPGEAAAVLAANPVLGAGPVTPTKVGGVEGAAVELTPRGGQHIFGRTVTYTVLRSRSYRLTFLETPGSMLVIMAVAIHRPPDATFALAKQVMDSVEFA